ncbi:MAG: hypothetical protein KatS3mg111_4216 [Pirellulaceae bacterium]|nr:MAG: hypothetical protein KatS3mg111_4216 [Pirellulaceae bacterium]
MWASFVPRRRRGEIPGITVPVLSAILTCWPALAGPPDAAPDHSRRPQVSNSRSTPPSAETEQGKSQHAPAAAGQEVGGPREGSPTKSPSPPAPSKWLGVYIKSLHPELATFLGGSDGVFVVAVSPGSPADKAGLRPGDVLLEADGVPLKQPQDLVAVLRSDDADTHRAVSTIVRRRDQVLQLAILPSTRPVVEHTGHALPPPYKRFIEQLRPHVPPDQLARLIDMLHQTAAGFPSSTDFPMIEFFEVGPPAVLSPAPVARAEESDTGGAQAEPSGGLGQQREAWSHLEERLRQRALERLQELRQHDTHSGDSSAGTEVSAAEQGEADPPRSAVELEAEIARLERRLEQLRGQLEQLRGRR